MPITDQAAERMVLLKLEPYDPSGGGAVVSLYVADRDYATAPGDTPANTAFAGVVVGAPTFKRSLHRDRKIGGLSIPARGAIVLGNGSLPGQVAGELDDWLGYRWSGRSFTLWIKEVGAAWSAAVQKAKGRIADLDYDRDTLSLSIRDRQEDERKPFQTATYSGGGGFDGGDDLKGKFKPLGFGKVRNVPAVPVDTDDLWFDLHDGAIEAVDAVRDNGVALASDPSNPPGAGGPNKYYADLANGRIRLRDEPAGLVAADFQGSKTAGVYVSSAAKIVRRILAERGGLVDPTDFDTAAFDALHTANPAAVGVWVGPDGASIGEILDQLLDTVGGFRTFTEDDLVTVGRVEAPDIAVADDADCALEITADDVVEGTLKRVNPGLPPSSIVPRYRRHYASQDADALAGGVSAADRLTYSQEWRAGAPVTAASSTEFPSAEPLEVDLLFDDAADAAAEASRLATMLGTARDVFELVVGAEGLGLQLNDQVWLSHDRFGLTEGRAFRVIGLDPDWVGGVCGLTLWG